MKVQEYEAMWLGAEALPGGSVDFDLASGSDVVEDTVWRSAPSPLRIVGLIEIATQWMKGVSPV
jgi:hypothetical protein